MKHPFLEGLSPTLHIAHRGGAALAPENTLVAFRQAVDRWRTDMLELDVQRTRDGELVVAHDETVDRCTDGTGRVMDLTWAELSRLDAGYRFTPDGRTFPFRGRNVRIPRLVEVLRAFDVRVNLELKPASHGSERELAELLRREGAVSRVCVGSEDDEIGARLFEALPDGCHFYPRQAATDFVLKVKWGEEPPRDDRFTVLDVPLTYDGAPVFDAALREAAERRGKWINVWTVDDPEQVRRLVAERVGGIMTDRPDLLMSVLDECKRQ